MLSRGEEVAARARGLVGVRFRPQGRNAAEGLDCVGVAAAALGLSPATMSGVRADYAPRGGSADVLAGALAKAGLECVAQALAGDVLVMRAGPGQLHLGVWTGTGLVHADAGMRRVVERPGAVCWPVVSVWRVRG